MATYYVNTSASGDGLGGDESNFMTMASATATAGTGNKFWVKAGTYSTNDTTSEVMDIDVAGIATAWNEWEAYTTTTGDYVMGTQPVVIDATSTLTNPANFSTIAAACYHRITGFRFTGGTGAGIEGSTNCSHLLLRGCKIDSNAGLGIQWDNYLYLFACEINGNGGGKAGTIRAIDCDSNFVMIGCKVHDSWCSGSTPVILTQTGWVLFSQFYDNAAGPVFRTGNDFNLVGNTFDGDGGTGSHVLEMTGSTLAGVIVNNIIYDYDIAISMAGGTGDECRLHEYNLFYSNTTDYEVITKNDTEIAGTADPFTDSANRDYTLKASSEALHAGVDGSII